MHSLTRRTFYRMAQAFAAIVVGLAFNNSVAFANENRGVIYSIEGEVFMRTSSSKEWRPAKVDDPVAKGDSLE